MQELSWIAGCLSVSPEQCWWKLPLTRLAYDVSQETNEIVDGETCVYAESTAYLTKWKKRSKIKAIVEIDVRRKIKIN